MKLTKDAILGRTTLGKIAMAIFLGLLLLTVGSCMFGCASPNVVEVSSDDLVYAYGEDFSLWPQEAIVQYLCAVEKGR